MFLPKAKGQIVIEIHDSRYSCYNSEQYFLSDSSLEIISVSEHGEMYDENYSGEVEYFKTLSAIEAKQLKVFMNHFPLDSLKKNYESSPPGDCNEERWMNIDISYRTKRKNIQITQCYQPDIAKLFSFIYSLIAEEKSELRINYTKEEFEKK